MESLRPVLPSCNCKIQNSNLWLSMERLTATIIPSVSSFYYSVLVSHQQLIESFTKRILPALVAFLANSISLSLASVQKISSPIYLKTIERQLTTTEQDMKTEKCVECTVLYEPAEVEWEADVIFIHGIHGGVEKTWRQGSWRKETHKLNQQLPIRRESSGNMYVPPRRQTLKRAFVDVYSKIPNKITKNVESRWFFSNDFETDDEVIVDENGNYSKCWPQDWIQKDCSNVRVIAVNYSTDNLWYPIWSKKRQRTDMIARSEEMIEELVKLNVGKKPIIWVGHSKGGLYIKQIIVNLWENHQDNQESLDLFKQTNSIMWYSVPHRGSILADFCLPFLKRSVELLEIQRNCDHVLDLHKKFIDVINTKEIKPEIFSFIETSYTLMAFIYMKIIAYDSADPNIGVKCDVPLDHREICKPAGRDCFLYKELINLIKKCINNSGIN